MFTPDLTGTTWIKSSFSSNGNCVEIAQGTRWTKSSFSGNGEACVEIAHGDTWVAMRDSKDPDGPALVFDRAAMSQFIAGVRSGEFDLA